MAKEPDRNLPDDASSHRKIREQYEQFPYPPRDPERERTQFNYVFLCDLDSMNHYHYGGKRDFTKGFRALVAGGGTGDATIMLAEQFRELSADIIHLDLSNASMQVARNRANVRRLNNITWIHGSLLDAPRLFAEPFDYIDCCGVLHHLESPEAGLQALASVLKPDGLIGLMLYGKYGREGVYQIRNLMKLLNQGEDDLQIKADRCMAVLKDLPLTSGFKSIEALFAGDIKHGAPGIHDLFLNAHDVAFSVPEIYALLATCGLSLDHFLFGDCLAAGNDLYRLESYISDGTLSSAIVNLGVEDKQAAAELMHGRIVKHFFYASKTPGSEPSADDQTQVPFLSMWLDAAAYLKMCDGIRASPIGRVVEIDIFQKRVKFTKTIHADLIFQHLDGRKSIAELFRAVAAHLSASDVAPVELGLRAEFRAIYEAFRSKDCMYLRDKSSPPLKSMVEMQRASVAAWQGIRAQSPPVPH